MDILDGVDEEGVDGDDDGGEEQAADEDGAEPPPPQQWPAKLFDGSKQRPSGNVSLTSEALAWQSSSDDSETTISLSSITECDWNVGLHVSVFERVNRCTVRHTGGASVIFDFPFNLPDGISGSTARLFVDNKMKAAIETAKAAIAPDTPTPPATPPATTAPAVAAPTAASATVSAPRDTKRVREGRKLREQLRELNRLRYLGKGAKAVELATELESARNASKVKQHNDLARQRVRELRAATFSFGGLELTREIVRRFVDSPEVKPLLTEMVLQRRRDAVDGKTARVLIAAAKSFFTELLKAPRGAGAKRGGRRTDDDRNAYAAALAALLPSDLFANRRGRAAMRLLGLTSCRQAKRGTTTRGEMEDRSGGWKRIKTSDHFDKVRDV